jgi:nicotinate-nucleotide adenylyltransferase
MSGLSDRDLARCRRIVIYGGSFDPPHRAHIELPEAARVALDADVVAYVPAAKAPHKLDRVQTDPKHRLAMLRLAVQGAPRAVVLTDEIDRGDAGEPSYTVDTLEALRRRLGSAPPGPELRLLIGADQVRIFDTWRESGRIVELAEPAVMLRPPDTADALLSPFDAAQQGAWRRRIVDVPALDVDSTTLRRQIAAGEDVSEWIPPAVLAYIKKHAIYGGR